MHREVIEYGEGLWSSLAPIWQTLGANDTSAFLSVEWVGAWIGAFGRGRRPWGVVWHGADERPVGCALLSVGMAKLGPFTVRRMYLNASGVGVGCEHNDVLAVPEVRAAILDDLISLVRGESVDELALRGVREHLYQELRTRWPEPVHEGFLSESPFVSLGHVRAGGEPYLSSLSSNTRSQIRRSIRLYQCRFGDPEVRAAGPLEVRAWFDRMVMLHTGRWRQRGGEGAFVDPAVCSFHVGLLEGTFEAPSDFQPELLRVSFGREAIAYLYQLRYRGRVSFYQSGLAYHDDNRLKPGLVAHAFAIEHYISLGESEYDLLGGEPEAVRYKRSLATDGRMLAWIELPSPTAKMRLLRGARLARRGVRSLWQRQ
ncbi:MAG: GNAT family N-acetyltransferase [Gemmatimonadota bacterium]